MVSHYAESVYIISYPTARGFLRFYSWLEKRIDSGPIGRDD
jgi:hypothetical protein